MKTIYFIDDDIKVLERLLNRLETQHHILTRTNRMVNEAEVQSFRQICNCKTELAKVRFKKYYEARTTLDL